MASKLFFAGLLACMNGTVNAEAAGAVKAILIKSGSSVASEQPTTLAGFGMLGQSTDSGYTPQTLTSVAWSASSNLLLLSAADLDFANSGNRPGESVIGMLLCVNTGGAQSTWIPLAYDEFDAAKVLTGITLPVALTSGRVLYGTAAPGLSRVYPAGLVPFLKGTRSLATAGVLRSAMLMSMTTALSEYPTTLSGFSMLDVCDDTGSGRVALTSVAASNTGSPLSATKIAAADLTFPNTGNASRAVTKILVYIHVDGTDANDIPLCCNDLDTDKTLTGTAAPIRGLTSYVLQVT